MTKNAVSLAEADRILAANNATNSGDGDEGSVLQKGPILPVGEVFTIFATDTAGNKTSPPVSLEQADLMEKLRLLRETNRVDTAKKNKSR